MTGKLFAITAVSALAIGFAAVPAAAQNAKVGAASSTLTVPTKGNSWIDVAGMTTDIRVPQQEDLSIDVALQCSLATDTTAKTKGGAKSSVTAEAGVKVRVRIEALDDGQVVGNPWYAEPSNDLLAAADSGVTFCQRSQTLEAVLQGQIDLESCLNDVDVFDPALCTLDYEEISLLLSTLSTHAFNFFTYDLTSGDYRVTVEANPDTNLANDDEDDAMGSADATALVGLGSMVIDEVRFGAIPN